MAFFDVSPDFDGVQFHGTRPAHLPLPPYVPLPWLSACGSLACACSVFASNPFHCRCLNDATLTGSWSVYPYFKSGTIVVSSIERGLFVLKANL